MTTIATSPELSCGEKQFWIFPLLPGLLLVSATLFFSFFGITRSLWLDEASSVYIANNNLAGVMANMKDNCHTPPFYYLLLSVWMHVFGAGEPAVRSLSAVFYVLSLFVMYRLGTELHNKKTGLLSSFLYMISPAAVVHVQNARMYTLLGFLGILSTLFFFRLFSANTASRKDLIAYIIVNIAGTFTHYWFFFLLFAQTVSYAVLLYGNTVRKFLAAMLLSTAPFFILWSRILLIQMTNGGTAWMTKPNPSILVSTVLGFYGGGKTGALVYAAMLFSVLVDVRRFALGIQNLARLKFFFLEKQNLALLLFLFLSLLVPFLISQVSPIYVENRYTIIALFPLVVLLASLLGRFANPKLVIFFCLLLLAGVSFGFVKSRLTRHPHTDMSTADYLIEQANDKDIFLFTGLSRTAVEYYLRLRKPDKNFIKISFPLEMEIHPAWIDEKKMLGEKDRLAREADQVVERLDTLLVKNDSRIWVLYGIYAQTSRPLIERLDQHCRLVKRIKLKDPFYTFYNEILVYQKKSASS